MEKFQKIKIGVIGRSEWTYNTIKLLHNEGFDIRFIITSKEAPEYKYKSSDFESLAENIGAIFLYNPCIDEQSLQLILDKTGQVDICVSVNYSGVISKKVIELFPLGVLNAHGGDLPKYRGNACQAWAILNGEISIGLCIHRMIGGELDSGDILAKKFYPIDINTRISQIYEWFDRDIPVLFLNVVNILLKNPNFVLEVQSKDPSKALRCYPRKPEDARIDWCQSAVDIVRLVNASSEPYEGAFCYNSKNELIRVWRAEEYPDDERWYGVPGQIAFFHPKGLVVLTGVGKILISEIEYQEKRLSPKYFFKSVRSRLH